MAGNGFVFEGLAELRSIGMDTEQTRQHVLTYAAQGAAPLRVFLDTLQGYAQSEPGDLEAVGRPRGASGRALPEDLQMYAARPAAEQARAIQLADEYDQWAAMGRAPKGTRAQYVQLGLTAGNGAHAPQEV